MSLVSILNQHQPKLKNILLNKKSITFDKNTFSLITEENLKVCCIQIQFEKPSIGNVIKFELNDINVKLNFHIYYSGNKEYWFSLPIRHQNIENKMLVLNLPLIETSYIEILISRVDNKNISSILKTATICQKYSYDLQASSEKDRLYEVANITDGRMEYGWISNPEILQSQEFILASFSEPYFITAFTMKVSEENQYLFPKKIHVELSMDNKIWHVVYSSEYHIQNPLTDYINQFSPTRAKYFKMVFLKDEPSIQVHVLELNIFATPENLLTHKNDEKNLHYASEMLSGMVQFAPYNASETYKAVQSSDPRLSYASTLKPGIMQLARDGESKEGLALQSNDSRLNYASELEEGIVRLARDGEVSQNKVLQSNDARLRISSTTYPGIVQLAKDGESKEGLALQSNDSRLNYASELEEGIVRLAQDGEVSQNKVLQSNDSRLRVSSTAYPGIVQLAKHYEIDVNKVITSDDPRLKEGSESIAGRVQFAKNNESSVLKAVQSNDSRLQKATERSEGLVRLAALNIKEPNSVVQANDPRLENQRIPKPHTHDNYAAKNHDFNSHGGTLNIQKDINFESVALPPFLSLPFSVKNTQGWAAGFWGGLYVTSNDKSSIFINANHASALEGYSNEKPAGILLSTKNYALTLPKLHNEKQSSGLSLNVEGLANFQDKVYIKDSGLSLWFESISQEAFSEGDILGLNPQGQVEKIKSQTQSVIGVYTSKPKMVLNAPQYTPEVSKKQGVHVCISGKCNVRVIGDIQAGDYLSFSKQAPGIAKKIQGKDSAIAIALESSSQSNERLISCLLKI